MTRVFEPISLIRDLAPPEGRVTVELLDERGLRVVQRERADNAILTHWNETMKLNIRGQDNSQAESQGYMFHGNDATFLNTNTDMKASAAGSQWYKALQLGLPVWSTPIAVRNGIRSIMLSDSTQAVNADEYLFPGEMTAFCYMPEAYAPSTNLRRTQLVVASSTRTPTALHYVAEWGTAYANGTHNSVGVGGVTWPASLAAAGAPYLSIYPTQTASASNGGASDVPLTSTPAATFNPWYLPITSGRSVIGASTYTSSSDVPYISGFRVSDSEWWICPSLTAGNNLLKINAFTATVEPFTANSAAAGVAVTGPTMTTIGASTNRCGVCAISTDLWLAYGTTLKRCVKPTTTSLTVSNTYTPSGVGTLIDLTTDGTDLYWLDSTKVWVISASTGAVTSSWTHGLTGTMQNITYGIQPNRLYISYIATGVTAAVWNGSGTARTPFYIGAFTVAGTASGTSAFPSQTYSSGITTTTSGLIMPLDALNKHWLGYSLGNINMILPGLRILGPSHISRTVLGSPVTKTSANSMRVIYEFGF